MQSIDFSNWQKYNVAPDGSVYDQAIEQTTWIASATYTRAAGKIRRNYKQLYWPLELSYDFTANPDGSYQQVTKAHQAFQVGDLQTLNGYPTSYRTFSDSVSPTDTLMVDASGNVTTSGQENSENYQFYDSNGDCWNETIKSAAGVLTSVKGGSCAKK
ncbi:MAG: hypothetical protein P4M04_17040 [Acidobacteriota bacterium]|nr:hypothetical protein [Acidobacteriota bacterium]